MSEPDMDWGALVLLAWLASPIALVALVFIVVTAINVSKMLKLRLGNSEPAGRALEPRAELVQDDSAAPELRALGFARHFSYVTDAAGRGEAWISSDHRTLVVVRQKADHTFSVVFNSQVGDAELITTRASQFLLPDPPFVRRLRLPDAVTMVAHYTAHQRFVAAHSSERPRDIPEPEAVLRGWTEYDKRELVYYLTAGYLRVVGAELGYGIRGALWSTLLGSRSARRALAERRRWLDPSA